MLSYQHIYHAGNPADVHKHAILAAMLEYMTKKDKPLSYIETHGGRGLYHLDSAEALKTGEAAAGVEVLLRGDALKDGPYRKAIAAIRQQHRARTYPGSPLVAAQFLRPDDHGHIAELHPQEYAALADNLRGSRLRVHSQDGFEMAQSLCPPTPRRGMMLIDPSYELKDEYRRIPQEIAKLHRKWNVGVIALWYPILATHAHKQMIAALDRQNLPGVVRHQVAFPPVREGHRMVGSGMYILNAPWGINEALNEIGSVFA